MKLLITGGCGFIGSNFINGQILNTENTILNIDKLSYAGNKENLSNISNIKRYNFLKADICDLRLINQIILEYKPDALIHFAAESHVDRSIYNSKNFINTNIIGTYNLLTSCQKYLNKDISKNFRFIHISTDEVYGTLGKNGSFDEKSSYNPSSPYSASKAASDHLVRAWNKTYNFPSIITNCSNNYGPYQFPEKLIPLTITNCLEKKKIPIYGTGKNIRDWLFVDDHCRAIDTILNHGKIGNTYNIGGNNEINNFDIVETICKIMDKIKPLKNSMKYNELIEFVADRPGHDFRYSVNSKKIKKELNWNPKENFESGILRTINWYINNENWWRKIKK
tara:strand:- start:4306 stop:5316 length:1011 start_codon:yes stop_codon:yes gene_type:complete